jgi:hypothetical protein
MSSAAQPEKASYSRISLDIPSQHAPTAELVLRGIRRARHVSVTPIVPALKIVEGEDMPPLFTMMEDEKERLIPAIQRPHIRTFAAHTWAESKGLGERLISGVWGMPRYGQEFREESNWYRIDQLLLTDSIGRVLALKAGELPAMHNLLAHGHAHVAGIGEGTLGFLAQLSNAVQDSLVTTPAREL